MQKPVSGHYPIELRQQVQELYAHCKKFNHANNKTASWQLLTTLIPLFAVLAAMFIVAGEQYYLCLLLALPGGLLLTRAFALQHDCGHGSFFTSKFANETLGQIMSVLTFTPYDHWRRSHALHHATSGNLDRRGFGDIDTITVEEYRQLSSTAKWRYRVMRHPFIAIVIGSPLFFLVLQRGAFGSNLSLRESLPGLLAHNAALLLFYGFFAYFFGFGVMVSVFLPVVLVAAWTGGWLFFVQHQFEETLWDGADVWDVKIAALKGSSHLQLNWVLNWFSCDIGLHHIHHLSSRIPNYRLRECLAAHPGLQHIAPRLTLLSALKSMHLALWDESSRKLISFGEFRRLYA